jgi:hypothetical protein
MMDEPRESKLTVKWVIIVVLLMIGIDGLLTRLLESLWVSLRDRNSPAYLPLEWWMAAPFTLFVFAVLSALLTSFSGARSWFRMFLLLCGCKLGFTGVTTFFFSFRPYPDLAEAAMQASLLSLPSVLVHILLSGMIVLFLKDVFVGRLTKEERAFALLPEEEEEMASLVAREAVRKPEPWSEPGRIVTGAKPVAFEEERGLEPRPGGAGEAEEAEAAELEGECVLISVSEVLKLFPKDELAMSPSEIEEISPSVRIPLEEIVPQLSEGKVEVEALTVISSMPPGVFARSPEEMARKFPDGLMELPLREVVSRVPPGTFDLPEQEMQPDVDAEFADFFREPRHGVRERKGITPGAAPALAGKTVRPPTALKEPPGEGAPPEGVVEAAGPVTEESLVVSEEELLLFERSRNIVTVTTEAVLSQFPEEAMVPDESARAACLPEAIVIPLELIAAQLANGQVKLHARYLFPQFPEGCLSISEVDVVRSLPNGEVELPLSEIVPQLPLEVLAPPEDQTEQPVLDDMPDPFHEELTPALPEAKVRTPVVRETPRPGVVEVEPAGVAVQERRQPLASYADMLREENPLDLSVSTVLRLLPEGAFRVSAEELRRHIGGEAVKVPRSMVMGQLNEGRVVVPVEILTVQFLPEHFAMSIEQMKARFAEGLVELPLPELVGQVLEEVAALPEGQRLQPECDEISTPFQEVASGALMSRTDRPAVVSDTAERARPSEVSTSAQPATTPRGMAAAAEEAAERSSVVGVTAQEEAPPVETAGTILRTLLQKCKGLGVSEHLRFAAAESSALVLAPSSLNRESLVSATIGLAARVRGFCNDHGLGEPFKLVVSASSGVVVGGELVRGNPRLRAGLIILATLNRSGAGIMSLLLERFEPQLRHLSSFMGPGQAMAEVKGGPKVEAKSLPLKRGDFPEELCRKIVASLSDVGIRRCLSAATPSGEKVVAVSGENSLMDSLLSKGIFDIGCVSGYAPEVGVGEFQSLLLVTDRASITLDRSPADPSAYLLCFFPESPGEGLVRAKAAKAAKLLEP